MGRHHIGSFQLAMVGVFIAQKSLSWGSPITQLNICQHATGNPQLNMSQTEVLSSFYKAHASS